MISIDSDPKVRIHVMNGISPKISGKLQLGESNLESDSDGCGDPADPQAVRLCFLWLANKRAQTGSDSNLINQGNLQACLATNSQSLEECHGLMINPNQSRLLEALNQHGITSVIANRLSEKGFAAQHDE
ncbi:hypothetical protein DSO57_1031663 [Entomophthora muscae]|uniref:Uncharacterized protein n=1 Tax=Entomophthora muscae TaxID=34485 RepID=A0ACC2TMZ7_9FUNG|nr:hypothetical protein DSO57_1031663 [Entomophthora muscae]